MRDVPRAGAIACPHPSAGILMDETYEWIIGAISGVILFVVIGLNIWQRFAT
jgi:hypothetical protein